MATTKFIKKQGLIEAITIERTGWMNFKLILVLILSIVTLFLLSNTVSAGCCINDQSSYTSFNDVTCNDVSQQDCSGTYIASVASCREVTQCGCCVCNPSSPQSLLIYAQNDYSTSSSFCDSFCGVSPFVLLPHLSPLQCLAQLNATTITGTVRNQQGSPIVGAQITETGGSSTVTDRDGRYSLRISRTTTIVRATYLGAQNSITVDTTQRTSAWDIKITVTATTSRISGRVMKDQTSTFVQGAQVILTNPINYFTDLTDSQGQYQIDTVPIGDYSLEVKKCGSSIYREQIRIETNPLTKNVNLPTGLKERIEGIIRDNLGSPIQGANFVLQPQSGVATISDAQGRYAINNVDTNCDYSVLASKRPSLQDQSKNIFVSGEDTTLVNNLDFTLQRTAGFDFCSTVGDCRGEDRIFSTGDDCSCSSGSCNATSGLCSSAPIQSCCSYPTQCSPTHRSTGQCTGLQTSCDTSCQPVLNCPRDQELNPQTVNGVCSCGTDVTIDSQLSSIFGLQNVRGKYCCDSTSSPFISATPCTFLGSAIIEGTIETEEGDPLDAEVYVDGAIKDTSDRDTGFYRVYVDPDQRHELEFRRDPIYDPVSRIVQAFRLVAGQTLIIDAVLETDTRTCDYPTTPKVPFLTVANVACINDVRLIWDNDFCDNDEGVAYFVIENENTHEQFIVNKTQQSFVVQNLTWNQFYEFSIKAFYSDRGQPRYSEKTYSGQINSGQEICSTYCGSEFCETDTLRKKCNAQNQVVTDVDQSFFADCSQYSVLSASGNDWYCAGPDDGGKTFCLERTLCGLDQTNPLRSLGLTYDDVLCSRNPATRLFTNGCYIDTSTRSQDFCFACPSQGDDNYACSTYNSEFSCETNRCGVPGDCTWEDNSYGDLGEGTCYDSLLKSETRKTLIDQGKKSQLDSLTDCSQCSEEGDVFHNSQCTQSVCTLNGLCYSGQNNASCTVCTGNDYCSQYTNQNSCTNSTGRNTAYDGLNPSDDACGIGICYWDSALQGCYKDSDVDSNPDCIEQSLNGTTIINPACEIDVLSPVTIPMFDTVSLNNVTGDSDDDVLFEVSEEISNFSYCLNKYGDTPCNAFTKISGRDTFHVQSNIVSITPVQDFNSIINDDGVYTLRFFSEDLHKNLESLKTAYIFVDASKPSIFVNSDSSCINCAQQIDCSIGEFYKSNLSLNIRVDENVTCTDYLVSPGSSIQDTPDSTTFSLDVLQTQRHSYGDSSGLSDGNYLYVVECTDSSGNKQEYKETVKIDSYDRIRDVRPSGAIANTDVSIFASTTTQSLCRLTIDGGREFVMDDTQGIQHFHNAVFGINTHHAYELRCYDQGQNRTCDREQYEFSIDRLAPRTLARINSKEIISDSWLEVISSPTTLSLEAEDPDIQTSSLNYGVDYIQYCLRPDGRSCVPGSQPGDSIVYGDTARINIASSTGVCYSAVDKGGNKENVKCGKILFEAPPLVTINNPLRLYVTNNPSFNLSGVHDAQTVGSSILVISNGSESTSFAIQADPTSFSFQNNFLYTGRNTLTVEIQNGAGVFGSDSIEVYYDNDGPEIELLTPKDQEYGIQIEISAEISDLKYTELETHDGVGRISSAQAILRKGSFERYISLNRTGDLYLGLIEPTLLPSGFYDLVSGEYDVEITGEDIFGNENSEIFDISIIDTRPTSIIVEVNDSNYRDQNLFYTNDFEPEIIARTDEPSDCDITITSRASPVTRSMQSGDSLIHRFSSQEFLRFLRFVRGRSQEISAEIVCRDQSSNIDRTSLRIKYNDDDLRVLLRSSDASPEFFKQSTVYKSANEKINAKAMAVDGQEIVCTYSCIKNGVELCGEAHKQSMPNFGDHYSKILTEDLDYSLDGVGEYLYNLECSDKYGNSNNVEFSVDSNYNSLQGTPYQITDLGPRITNSLVQRIFVRTSLPSTECRITSTNPDIVMTSSISEPSVYHYADVLGLVNSSTNQFDIQCVQFATGETVQRSLNIFVDSSYVENSTIPVLLSQNNDTLAPIIFDVNVLGSLGERGVLDVARTPLQKEVNVVQEYYQDNTMVKLRADVDENVECRYDESFQNFAQMRNEFLTKGAFPTSAYILIPRTTRKIYFVACSDLSANIAQTFTVIINTNPTAALQIVEASPKWFVNHNGIILSARTYRDASCSYSGNGQSRSMSKTEQNSGYLHTSSINPGDLIYVQEDQENVYQITCTSSGLTTDVEELRFTLDSVRPVISLYSPLFGQSYDKTLIDFNGTTEANTELEFYVNGILKRSIHTNSGLFNTQVYVDHTGGNQINILTRDKAGNQGSVSVSITTSQNGPSIEGIYPVSAKLSKLGEIIAYISGDFDASQSIFIITKNGSSIQGSTSYDTVKRAFSFIPSSEFLDGSYEVEVVPKDSSGNVGFGLHSNFEIDRRTHGIDWLVPDKRVYRVGGTRLFGEYEVTPRTGLILDTRTYVVPSLNEVTEGANTINAEVYDDSKKSHLSRIVYTDTIGPSADITPSGSVNRTRPSIVASFSEDVTIESYSLREILDSSGSGSSASTGIDVPLNLINSSNNIFTYSSSRQLGPRRYVFEITAKDLVNNIQTTTQEFTVSLSAFDVNLKNPKYGVASLRSTNISFETTQDANCRYSNIYSIQSHRHMNDFAGIFSITGQDIHRIDNYTIASEYPANSQIYVWCAGEFSGEMSVPKQFTLSYDLSAPVIQSAAAFPNPVVELPLSTNISVRTDDEAMCRYDCEGRVNYDLMQGIFGGTFTRDSSTAISLQDNQNYSCNVICMNRAETFSNLKLISIMANTSMQSDLLIVSPADGTAYPNGSLSLVIRSNKIAQCSYELDSNTTVFLPGTARQFNATLPTLLKGPHVVDVSCVFGVGTEQKSSHFIVDNTPPSNMSISVSDIVCSSTSLGVRFNSTDSESGIKGFYYKISRIDQTNSSLNYTVINSTNQSYLFTISNTIPTSGNLTVGRYIIEAYSQNNAGLVTGVVRSNPININPSQTSCNENNPPTANLTLEQSPGSTRVTLVCQDNESGCSPTHLYSLDYVQTTCVANSTYSSPVDVDEPSYFCYVVKDLAGNSKYGSEYVDVLGGSIEGCVNDLDCDLILDSVDNDTDGDSLLDCPYDTDKDNDGVLDFNFIENRNEDEDDDSDGTLDSEEVDTDNDWDNDGILNKDDSDLDCDTLDGCDDVDDDNDGILDVNDDDSDNDGVLDSDDIDRGGTDPTCKYDKNVVSSYSCRDDDNDLDKDGISNIQDDDVDGDSISNSQDTDNDNDGVIDCIDQDDDNDGELDGVDSDNSNDWDNDGMRNDWEKRYGLDPYKNDSSGDKDADGLSNLDEQTYGTDPSKQDTDGDGYTDYDELFGYDVRYDPLDPESRPKSKLSRFLLVLAALAIIGAAGYYLYTKYSLSQSQLSSRRVDGGPAFSSMEKTEKEPSVKKQEGMTRFEKEVLEKRKFRELENDRKKKLRSTLFGDFSGKDSSKESSLERIRKLESMNLIAPNEAKKLERKIKLGSSNVFAELEGLVNKHKQNSKSSFDVLDSMTRTSTKVDSFEKLGRVTGIENKRSDNLGTKKINDEFKDNQNNANKNNTKDVNKKIELNTKKTDTLKKDDGIKRLEKRRK